jgi:RNA polymerase-binding transcription factor DksA
MSARDNSLTQRLAGRLSQREAELRALLQAAADAAVGASNEPADVMDFKDVAAADTQAVVSEATIEQATRELAQVAAALKRLDDGSYGLCLDCGEPIAEQRLLALPATPLCAPCQAIAERPRPMRR